MEAGILSLTLKIPLRGDGVKIALASALALAIIAPLTKESFLPYSVALTALATSSAILADSRAYTQLVRALTLCGFRRDRSWLVLLINSLFLSTITSVAGITWMLGEPVLVLIYPVTSVTTSLFVGIVEMRSEILRGEVYGR